jgi:hypothetical protein
MAPLEPGANHEFTLDAQKPLQAPVPEPLSGDGEARRCGVAPVAADVDGGRGPSWQGGRRIRSVASTNWALHEIHPQLTLGKGVRLFRA